jgi:hypothetical protein
VEAGLLNSIVLLKIQLEIIIAYNIATATCFCIVNAYYRINNYIMSVNRIAFMSMRPIFVTIDPVKRIPL